MIYLHFQYLLFLGKHLRSPGTFAIKTQNPVYTSQRTQYFVIVKKNKLTEFKKMVAVRCRPHEYNACEN